MKAWMVGVLVAGATVLWNGQAIAQASSTPNLCNTVATDIASRYVVQLMSGSPARSDRTPDPLIGRFATAVRLYGDLLCPMPPLSQMLECLQVAAIETGGDMRSMIPRRRACEQTFQDSLFGR